MTLFNDICEVHDGVVKAHPLHVYDHGIGIIGEYSKHILKQTPKINPDHECVYKKACEIAIESVKIMQLASKNIEKELHEIKQEVEDEKASNIRELFDNLPQYYVRDCHQAAFNAIIEDVKKNMKENQPTIEKMIPTPANNHPIAVFRIEHDKPVFAYVSRGVHGSEDVKEAKVAIRRKAKDEPDYVFEIGVLLGTVRKT